MTKYVLRLEAVDFTPTIGDTQNLQALRGGSLAMLKAPGRVRELLKDEKGFSEIFAAASLGAWRFEANDKAQAEAVRARIEAGLRQQGPFGEPFQHLGFAVDIAEGDDLDALKRAEARNYARQVTRQCWSLPEFAPSATGATMWDPNRPAYEDFRPPEARGQKRQTSPSYKARWEHGRKAKQTILGAISDGAALPKGWRFSSDFEEMVSHPPGGVAESLRNKYALFYADGNKFGKMRSQTKTLEQFSKFSQELSAYNEALAKAIVDWLKEGAKHRVDGDDSDGFSIDLNAEAIANQKDDNAQFDAAEGNKKVIRFETLMWGGDELVFVMPAWLGFYFARKFLDWTQDWKISPSGGEAYRLTFGMGLVFCNFKTPVRQARKVAEKLAEKGKLLLGDDLAKQENVLQVEAFESIALPDVNFNGYRHALYDLSQANIEAAENALRNPLDDILTLQGEAVQKFLDGIVTLRMKETFPRSQVYNFLKAAIEADEFNKMNSRPDDASLDKGSVAAIVKYAKRAGRDRLNDVLPPSNRIADNGKVPDEILKKAALDALCVLGRGKPTAYSLAALATFWDYADPLDMERHKNKQEKAA